MGISFGRIGRAATAAWIALAMSIAAITYATLIEPRLLRPRRWTVPCAGIRGSPVRVLLLSDLDFTGEGRAERRIREIAEDFDPDLVLVAGDFLDRAAAFSDEDLLREAHGYLQSLPARVGRFLVPGEEEALDLVRWRRAWKDSQGVEILVNESRRLQARGESLELFGADPARDPVPWRVVRRSGRSYIESDSRRLPRQELVYRGSGADAWGNVEISVTFQAVDADTYFDIRFGRLDEPGPFPLEGSAWILRRHDGRPSFFLNPGFLGLHELSGRSQSTFEPPPGRWCRARIRLVDDGDATRIRARFWPAWAPEPTAWSIDVVDRGADRRRRGAVAFAGRGGRRRIDHVRVTRLDGVVLLEEGFDDPARLGTAWHYRSALASWLREPREGAVRLLLSHSPDIARDVKAVGADPPDLVLAGHTHGGQVRLPVLGALFTATELGPRYDAGLFDYRGVRLCISAGAGTSGMPFRFLSPPDLVLLTLVPEAPRYTAPAEAR